MTNERKPGDPDLAMRVTMLRMYQVIQEINNKLDILLKEKQ